MSVSPVSCTSLLAIALLLPFMLIGSAVLRAAELQIGSLEDIDFGRVPPTANRIRARASFCVALEPRGRYSITATGNGPGGRFLLQQSSASQLAGLAYSVRVTDRGRRRGRLLQPGIPLSGLRALAPRPDGSCRGPFGTISVSLRGLDLRAARPGLYRGTLSLTVAPE